VAARGPEGEDARAGIEVVQRLLLDRIDAEAGRSPVAGENDLSIAGLAHEAERLLPFVELAEARAEVALDAAVLEPVLPRPADDPGLDLLSKGPGLARVSSHEAPPVLLEACSTVSARVQASS